MNNEVTSEDLIEAATRAGFQVGSGRLKRLRQEGLLPKPRQEHIAGLRGSRSLYAAVCINQLLAVCRVARAHRNMDLVRFAVWWEGQWVEFSALRRSLVVLIQSEVSQVEGLASRYPNSEDAADAVASHALKSRHPFIRLLRDRLSKRKNHSFTSGVLGEDLMTVVHHLIAMMQGSTPIWTSPDMGLGEVTPRELMETALGLDRAAKETFTEAGPAGKDH